MKNITVAVPDSVYRGARVRAAERGSSVSALVAEFLRGLAAEATQFETLRAKQEQIRATLPSFRGGTRLSRDEIHGRGPVR